MAPAISTQIPQYLVQMPTVKLDICRNAVDIEREIFGCNFLNLAKLVVKFLQKIINLYGFLSSAVSAIKFKHIDDDVIKPAHIICDDLQQPFGCQVLLFFLHQLISMADCTQWVTYFVRDIGCQSAKRSQF